MTQTPTDALRLVPDDHLAALIQQADDGFGYSMEMVRLVDGVRTYRLKIEGQETVEITDGDDNDYDAQQACYRLINAAKNKVRADAVRTALAAAPASPLPGAGDWIDGTPEVPVGSPTWCGWASYEIRRLRSALPAAPKGDA